MGAPGLASKTSSSDVVLPAANSVSELHGTSRIVSSDRTAGSPEESKTTTQQPDDAIFMYKSALQTSLWEKIWPLYYSYKQETNENEE